MLLCQQHERRPEGLRPGVSLADLGVSNMAKRKTYHVTGDGEGGWRVKAAGGARASSTHENKTDAVQSAKDLAKAQPLGQIVIHRKDGQIQTEHTYGKDPHPPKG